MTKREPNAARPQQPRSQRSAAQRLVIRHWHLCDDLDANAFRGAHTDGARQGHFPCIERATDREAALRLALRPRDGERQERRQRGAQVRRQCSETTRTTVSQ